MPTTVYFATNRQVTDPADPIGGYPPTMVPPLSPDQMTYGTAFVDGIDIATNAQGVVSQVANTNKGSFHRRRSPIYPRQVATSLSSYMASTIRSRMRSLAPHSTENGWLLLANPLPIRRLSPSAGRHSASWSPRRYSRATTEPIR
jgi:hypothetical protein